MDSLIPAFLALSAAALFGFNLHLQRQALEHTDATTGALLSVGTTAVLCWVIAPFLVDPAWFFRREALIFAAIGLLFPALGQYLQIRAVGLVGPSLSASLGSVTPVVAVAIGVVWLHEPINVQASLGIALMVVALVAATWSPRGIKRGWPLWALLVPIGAALTRGLAQPAIRDTLQTLPSPFFSLLIGASVSTLVLALLVAQNRARGRMRFGPGAGRFVVVGLLNGSGIFCLNLALGLGALALVSPLISTSPLWTLLFAVTLFRRETLKLQHVLIAVLVVVGGALILTH